MSKGRLQITALHILIIVVLGLGIFFRFVNLDRKVYWIDEVYTSLRISGHTRAEYIGGTFNNKILSVADLQKYVQIHPEKDLNDTLRAFAGNSEHPPLYYLLASFWVRWLGTAPTITRSLSALISLLAFPCVYWLCRELFDSSLTGSIALALIAVSPLHILYAQEARQYSLWMVTILLSSATLLRAMRVQTLGSWGLYAVSLVLGFYTSLFSGLVAIAHGIYVIVSERFRVTKITLAYFLASLAGFLTFSPWLVVIITNLDKIEKATTGNYRRVNLLSLAKTWVINLSRVFLDFSAGTYTVPLILILVGCSFYFLYRHASKKTFFFISIFIIVVVLPLILADLVIGLKLSTRPRYLIPAYLIVQITVAYLITTKMFVKYSAQRWFWKSIFVILISGGILSASISTSAYSWWHKGNPDNHHLARILNQSPRPLVISSNNSLNPDDLLSLSYLLDPKVKFQLIGGSAVPEIPDGFSDVFLYNPRQEVQAQLEKQYKIERVSNRGRLWSINQF